MFKIHSTDLFIILLITKFSVASRMGTAFALCHQSLEESNLCTIKNMYLTKELFEFDTMMLPEITKVRITDSTIVKLGNGMCRPPMVFIRKSNIEELQLSGLSIKEIIPYAFHQCNLLKILNLRDNKIKNLDKTLFSLTVKLEYIDLSNNLLQKLPIKLFYTLSSLRELYLSRNHLTSFPPELLATCPALEQLKLDSNDLFDLNLKKIVEYTPVLRDVAFNDNQLRCERVAEIRRFMKGKSIWTNEYFDGNGRDRNISIESEQSIRCLGDIPWAIAHYIHVYETIHA